MIRSSRPIDVRSTANGGALSRHAHSISLLARGDRGFTLIELLVVVIIIGVLAAIAIPVYIGVQNNSKDGAVKSDLFNAKTAVVSYLTQKGGVYPAAIDTATLKSHGFSGPSVTYTTPTTDQPHYKGGTVPAANATAFCLEAVSPSTATFFVTESTGVKSGACP